MNYSTGTLCRLLGIGEKTLRLYEQKGFMAPARREGSTYRAYTERELERLLEIKKYQSEQRSLSEITDLLTGMPFEQTQAMLDENIAALEQQIESLQVALHHLQGARRNRQENYDGLGTVRRCHWANPDRYVILDSDQPVPQQEKAFETLRAWSFARAELNLITLCEPGRVTPEGTCGWSIAVVNKTMEEETSDMPWISRLPTGEALSLSLIAPGMNEIWPSQLEPLRMHCPNGKLPEKIILTHNVRFLREGKQALLLRALAFCEQA